MEKQKKHFRIAALQNNFRSHEETLKVIDTWSGIGFNTEQLFHVCGDAFSSLYNPKLHHDTVKEYLEKAERNGIGIIFYLNCHIMNPSEDAMSPQWATRKADGSYNLLYNTYHGTCLRSTWREHFFESIRGLSEFNIMGIFFDGPIWGVKCACPTCRKEFQERYGKPFDEGTDAEHEEFDRWSVDTFKADLRRIVKETNPAWLMYFNEGLMSGRFNAEYMKRQIAYNDLIGTEHGGFFGHAPNSEQTRYWTTAEGAKLAKAVAGDKPSVIFFAGDHKPWSWRMHAPAETRITYSSIIANGCSVWYGLHNDPEYLKGAYDRAIRDMVAFDRKWTDIYDSMSSKAQLAVFYSFNTVCNYSRTGMETDLYRDESRTVMHPGNYTESLRGAEGMLEHCSIPWDIVTELNLDKLPQYKALLAPTLAMTDDATADALEKYVKEGGTIIADGEFGFFDRDSKRLETSLLERLVGAKPTGAIDTVGHFNYFTFDDRFYGEEQTAKLLPLPDYFIGLEDNGAEVIARACTLRNGPYVAKPDTPNRPFAIAKSLGKGRVIYMAGGMFQMYYNYRMTDYRKCFMKILDSIYSPDFRLAGACPGVSMTVSESLQGTVVHLLNYVSAIWPIESVAPQEGLALRAPAQFTSAKALVAGKELQRNEKGEWMLPRLNEFEVILLK